MQNRNRDFLIPSSLELVLYGVLTVGIMFIANLSTLTNYFLSQPQASATDLTFKSYADRFVGYIENLPFLPNSAVFVFWSLVGLIIYSLLQSIYSVYAEVKNDIETTHFMHPSNFIRWQFWAEVAVQFLAHVSLYGVTLLWGFLVGYVLVPLSASFARQFFEAPGAISAGRLLCGSVLLYIGVLMLALILKLFFKRKQLIL